MNHMKAILKYFPVALFITLYKMFHSNYSQVYMDIQNTSQKKKKTCNTAVIQTAHVKIKLTKVSKVDTSPGTICAERSNHL